MSYTIIKSNGNTITVDPNAIDSTYPIQLVGKNATNYGTAINQNFFRILENFANVAAPSNPQPGQLWYDSGNVRLNFRTSGSWKPLSGTQVSASEPTSSVSGDLWFDSVNQQLKIYSSGNAWTVIGPTGTAASGVSGFVTEKIPDPGTDYYVAMYANGQRIGIFSDHAITSPGVTGFGNIYAGINFRTSGNVAGIYRATALTVGTTEQTQITNSANDTVISNSVSANLIVRTGGSDRITVNSSGNVGFGNSSPTTLLDVYSATVTGDLLTLRGAIASTGDGPSILFNQHTGTALKARIKATYVSTTNNLELSFQTSANGSLGERMRIDGSGNVGIGNTAPMSLLTVGSQPSPVYLNPAKTFSAGQGETIGTSANAVIYHSEFDYTAANQMRLLLMGYRRAAGSDWQGAGWRLQSAVDNSYTAYNSGLSYIELSNYSSGSLYLGTAGADRLTINSSGNVGIGTVSPTQLLDVAGNVKITGTLLANAGPVNLGSVANLTVTGGASGQVLTTYGNGVVYWSTVSGNGNVSDPLTIGGISVGNLSVTNSFVSAGNINTTKFYSLEGSGTKPAASTRYISGNSSAFGSNAGILFNVATGQGFEFTINGSNAAVINPSGNFGIGTTISPAVKFQVRGGTDQNFGVGPAVQLSGAAVIHAANDAWNANVPLEVRYATTTAWFDSSTERMRIQNGNVGIGNTAPMSLLTVGSQPSPVYLNPAKTFSAGQGETIGTSANAVTYHSEFDYTAANQMRLLLMGYRRAAGSDWQGAGWRLQSAVDSSFTAYNSGLSYIELSNYSSGSLYLGTAGADRLTINSSGNVGIGNTAPTTVLDVYSATETGDLLTLRGAINAGGDGPSILFNQNTGTALKARIKAPHVGATNNLELSFWTSANGSLAERMRIDGSGNVGIGTTSPATKLAVSSGVISIDTSGQSRTFSTYYAAGSDGYNILIGGGGASSTTSGQTYHGSYNTSLGVNALQNNTTGYQNTATGVSALYSNSTGNYNTATGVSALYSNSTGNYNTAVGSLALYSNSTGHTNTTLGFQSLSYNTTGYQNTAVGSYAGYLTNAGANNQSSFNSVYVGYDARPSADGNYNEIVLGASARGSGNNSATYGSSGITKHIFTAGDVGIGVSNPLGKLHVSGYGYYEVASNVYLTLGQEIAGSPSPTTYAGMWWDSGNNSLRIEALSGGVSWRNVILQGAGGASVGIGTTSPTAKLHVKDSSAGAQPTLTLQSAGTSSGDASVMRWLNSSGTERATIYQDSAGDTMRILSAGALAFSTNQVGVSGSNERVNIDVNGNVGIGTGSPSQLLDVAGNVKITGNIFTGSSGTARTIISNVSVISANTSAIPGVTYITTANVVLTLPAAGNVVGDRVGFVQALNTLTNCVINPNGGNIMSSSANLTVDIYAPIELIWTGNSTVGWVLA